MSAIADNCLLTSALPIKLAEKVDINIRNVQRIEAGEINILITTAKRIKTALECSWDDLMEKGGGTGEREARPLARIGDVLSIMPGGKVSEISDILPPFGLPGSGHPPIPMPWPPRRPPLPVRPGSPPPFDSSQKKTCLRDCETAWRGSKVVDATHGSC
jgi:DNA-binding XRE family transcriptional regulator